MVCVSTGGAQFIAPALAPPVAVAASCDPPERRIAKVANDFHLFIHL